MTIEPIALRVNLRVDLAERGQDPEPALLMSAAPDRLLLRMTRARTPGETLRLVAEPNFVDSFVFTVKVLSCVRRLVPSENLDYFEMWAQLENPDDSYRRFLGSARKTARELKEDVRLLVRLPVEVSLGARRFRSHLENVSFGGVFLFCETPQTLCGGERPRLELSLPGAEEPLVLEGEVVYTLDSEQAIRLGAAPGAGIRLALDEASLLRWEELVGQLHRQVVG